MKCFSLDSCSHLSSGNKCALKFYRWFVQSALFSQQRRWDNRWWVQQSREQLLAINFGVFDDSLIQRKRENVAGNLEGRIRATVGNKYFFSVSHVRTELNSSNMFKLHSSPCIWLSVSWLSVEFHWNPMPKRIEKADKHSNQDLAAFVHACNINHKQIVTRMTKFTIKIARSDYEHSVELKKSLSKMVTILQKLAHSRGAFSVKALAELIDSKRDNKSHYDL